MANIFEPTDQQKTEWDEWVESRPEKVRDIARKFQPWKLYRLASGGHRVTLGSIDEHADGSDPTFTVTVSGEFNLVVFSRNVFGVKPEELTECDLPDPGEPLGDAGMSIEDVKKILNRP